MKQECRDVREALLDLPDPDRLPDPFLSRHLEACPDCSSFWRQWRDVGQVLRALDLPEPVDRGAIALAMARAGALQAAPPRRRPLSRDLIPALLLGSLIMSAHAGAWSLWGVAGLAAVQAVSGLLLPLAILGAARQALPSTGRAGR